METNYIIRSLEPLETPINRIPVVAGLVSEETRCPGTVAELVDDRPFGVFQLIRRQHDS